MFYCYAKHSDILWRLSQVCRCLMLHVRCWVAVVKNGRSLLDLRTLKSAIYVEFNRET